MVGVGFATVLAFVWMAQPARLQTPLCSYPVQCGKQAPFSTDMEDMYLPAGRYINEQAPYDSCSLSLPPSGIMVTACSADSEPELECEGDFKVRVRRTGDRHAPLLFKMVAYCLFGYNLPD